MNKNVSRALLLALIVGTFLNAVNSYDVFLKSNFTTPNLLRIALTYITPFCVSFYSSLKANKYKKKATNKDFEIHTSTNNIVT